MGKRVAVYLAVVLATGYLFLMYNEPALSAILALECLYPILSFLYLRWMSSRVSAGLCKIQAMGEKDKEIKIKIWVQNTSRLYGSKYKVRVLIGSAYTLRQVRRHFTGIAESRSREEQACFFSSAYCGRIEIIMDSLWVYDFFGIFFCRVKVGDKAVVGILPQFELMPLEITRRTREFLADADEHSVEKSGDDPAEIYQIRKYRPKDSVHDIHWKLTAKEDQLMVKEHGFPLGCVVLLWLDLPEEGKSAAGFDKLLVQTASLSMTLAEEKCIHMAAWFEEKNFRVVKYKVSDAKSVYELVWRLLDIEPYQNSEVKEIAYEDAFLGEHFSSIVVIDGQGNMKVNNEVQELLQL